MHEPLRPFTDTIPAPAVSEFLAAACAALDGASSPRAAAVRQAATDLLRRGVDERALTGEAALLRVHHTGPTVPVVAAAGTGG